MEAQYCSFPFARANVEPVVAPALAGKHYIFFGREGYAVGQSEFSNERLRMKRFASSLQSATTHALRQRSEWMESIKVPRGDPRRLQLDYLAAEMHKLFAQLGDWPEH